MELKSAEFETALQLKHAYFTTNRSKVAFEQLIASSKSNYWAKRWLADIYRDGTEPFGYISYFPWVQITNVLSRH